jgi:pyrimidine operon attenuation protein/uracil phosphoribosyltransferase
MEIKDKRRIFDKEAIERILTRIAHEILERNKGIKDLVIIGIRSGGVALGKRLCKKIYEIEGVKIQMGIMDITLYRDDLNRMISQPVVRATEIPFSVDDKKIILVDDVLYTGRTIRAAMDAIMDFGRPRLIQLAVLIDRGHRELPIRADYVGKNLPTSKRESVKLVFDGDNISEVIIQERYEI